MNTCLARSLALCGLLLAPWGAGAQTPEGSPPADPAPRRALPAGEDLQKHPVCLLGNNFESGTVEGWGSTNVSGFSVKAPGSASSYCLYGHDASGGSTMNAPPSYLGDWSQKLAAGNCSCGEFCFDVNLLNDGVSTQPSFWPSFSLVGPGGNSANFQAVNRPKITDSLPPGPLSGWHRFCAPIRLTGGPPPTGVDGNWTLSPTSASWDAIVQNVTAVRFPVDWGTSLQTEEVAYDNFCLRCGSDVAKPSFTAPKICLGQPTHFTDTSTNASSWNWSFAGQGTSTLQNPTFTFTQAGTFPVKLCVAPSCGTVACITQPVTVVSPAPFTINGPIYATTGSATYCASPAQSGVTYNWSVTSPATVTPVNGNPCVTVTWNGANGGVVTATATTISPPQCPLSARLQVKPEPPVAKECCVKTNLGVTNESLSALSSPGTYKFQANFTASPGPITQATADVVSTIAIYPAGSTCGTTGPAVTAVLSAANILSLAGSVPVPMGHEALWQGGSTTLTGAVASFNLSLPFFTGACPADAVKICVKYTFTSNECRTCGLIECYDLPRPVCPGCQ